MLMWCSCVRTFLHLFHYPLTDKCHLINSICEVIILHDCAEFKRVFHITFFFVTIFFVVRCKDNNLL